MMRPGGKKGLNITERLKGASTPLEKTNPPKIKIKKSASSPSCPIDVRINGLAVISQSSFLSPFHYQNVSRIAHHNRIS